MLLEFPASKSNIPETAQQQQQEADRLRLSSYYVTAWNSPLRDIRSSLHSFHHFWSASMQVAVHVLAWLGGIALGHVGSIGCGINNDHVGPLTWGFSSEQERRTSADLFPSNAESARQSSKPSKMPNLGFRRLPSGNFDLKSWASYTYAVLVISNRGINKSKYRGTFKVLLIAFYI